MLALLDEDDEESDLLLDPLVLEEVLSLEEVLLEDDGALLELEDDFDSDRESVR